MKLHPILLGRTKVPYGQFYGGLSGWAGVAAFFRPRALDRAPVKRAVRFLAILVVVLIVVGSIADLCDGFRVLRSTHSWRMALLAMLGLGTLELLGEGVSGWLFRRGPR